MAAAQSGTGTNGTDNDGNDNDGTAGNDSVGGAGGAGTGNGGAGSAATPEPETATVGGGVCPPAVPVAGSSTPGWYAVDAPESSGTGLSTTGNTGTPVAEKPVPPGSRR